MAQKPRFQVSQGKVAGDVSLVTHMRDQGARLCLSFLPVPRPFWFPVFMLVQRYTLNVAAAAPGITSAFRTRRKDT